LNGTFKIIGGIESM